MLLIYVLNNRLNLWAENYSVYCEAQAGFRKNMGTVDNIFVLSNAIDYLLQQNKKLFVCYVDFTKAFDLLVRGNIFYKLIKYGIRGNIMNTIYSLYQNVKSSVV